MIHLSNLSTIGADSATVRCCSLAQHIAERLNGRPGVDLLTMLGPATVRLRHTCRDSASVGPARTCPRPVRSAAERAAPALPTGARVRPPTDTTYAVLAAVRFTAGDLVVG